MAAAELLGVGTKLLPKESLRPPQQFLGGVAAATAASIVPLLQRPATQLLDWAANLGSLSSQYETVQPSNVLDLRKHTQLEAELLAYVGQVSCNDSQVNVNARHAPLDMQFLYFHSWCCLTGYLPNRTSGRPKGNVVDYPPGLLERTRTSRPGRRERTPSGTQY
jgi:hypothetical protein